ncbi:Gfo/Idh/MocA family oxidoreductase [Virgibacillus proomii]|uniref:Gfo/Idh/MocA family oxidoreductase n=1 Tax=Virgibacillus proomii TaxID=84407 RepID=UPI001C0F9D58|nr:Gfo/Idh/MocA family oxidoreductase [Virgibacillus proomii]
MVFIGCGKISQTRHIPEYLDNKDCEVVAVADSNYSRTKEISQKFNIPYAYDNWMDIVEDKISSKNFIGSTQSTLSSCL